ncbi:MAG: hypothetical protein IJ589_05180, partial [Lachnospiraceae bacterium]|nr:hypothetical protein [Lachnospiraceae bacterium]
MSLRDFLSFQDIVIQCHDNPDADALASGYALHRYLTRMGKNPRFVYRGKNRIQKSNLLIMRQCRHVSFHLLLDAGKNVSTPHSVDVKWFSS